MLALLLAACSYECGDIKDAVCADTAPPDTDVAAWCWVDQDGRRVTDGPDLTHIDENGYVWSVVVGDATLVPYDVGANGGLLIWAYDALDCAGLAHASDVPGPRHPFIWEVSEVRGEIFVVPDDAVAFYGRHTSHQNAGETACYNRDVPTNEYWWWPFVAFTAAVPVTNWAPPLEPAIPCP